MDKQIFDALVDGNVHAIFLIGPGGCGKSYCLNKALQKYDDEDSAVCCLTWNHGEMPTFRGSPVHGAIGKLIFIRLSNDQFVKGMLKEFEE